MGTPFFFLFPPPSAELANDVRMQVSLRGEFSQIIRKTMQKVFVLIFGLAIMAGCSDDLIPIEDHAEVQKQLKGGENSVTESITGSGHLYRNFISGSLLTVNCSLFDYYQITLPCWNLK